MKIVWISIYILVSFAAGAQTKGPPSTPAEIEKEYQKRIKRDSIAGVYIPKDVQDAYKQLDKLIDAPSKVKFKSYPEEEVRNYGLKSLGKWMIINWSLYEGSRIAAKLKSMGIHHPDDMAQFLVIGYYRLLNNLPGEDDKRIKAYQAARKAEVDNRKTKGTVLSETIRKKPKPKK